MLYGFYGQYNVILRPLESFHLLIHLPRGFSEPFQMTGTDDFEFHILLSK